jgi:carbon-monoxide dehydrogenase medium subunit
VIGAMTRHADVAASAEVKAAIPALADLAAGIGDRQVRARGTLGGSVANNDPAACYPSAVLGLGATVITNQREIAADDFFVGMYTTALDEGEIITAIRFPIPKRAAYMKFKQPASRFSLVGVFVAQFDAGVRVAVTGASAACSATRGWKPRCQQLHSPGRRSGGKIDASDLNATCMPARPTAPTSSACKPSARSRR